MTSGATLEVVSATPLDPTEQQHVRDRIGKAFGAILRLNSAPIPR